MRTSTTDPQAHIMKMADGGYRPAYNAQLCADSTTQLIVGVEVVNAGNDAAQAVPMLEQLQDRYAQLPQAYLAVKPSRKAGVDPFQPKLEDSPAVAAWRVRMGSVDGKGIYKLRDAVIECVNAIQRNRGLVAFRVHGLRKVQAVLLWFALAHNMMRAHGLHLARASASG